MPNNISRSVTTAARRMATSTCNVLRRGGACLGSYFFSKDTVDVVLSCDTKLRTVTADAVKIVRRALTMPGIVSNSDRCEQKKR
jgi:hypothetical protein